MSRSLERSATELERKAKDQVVIIRRTVQEYNESVGADPKPAAAPQLKKQRKIEKAISDYMQTHKALKRIRKKMRVGK
jgi:hypothetical protein